MLRSGERYSEGFLCTVVSNLRDCQVSSSQRLRQSAVGHAPLLQMRKRRLCWGNVVPKATQLASGSLEFVRRQSESRVPTCGCQLGHVQCQGGARFQIETWRVPSEAARNL